MGFAPMNKGFAVPAIRLLWYPAKDITIITEPRLVSRALAYFKITVYFLIAIFFGFASSAFLNVTETIPCATLASGSLDRSI